jgi:hypothetical protein
MGRKNKKTTITVTIDPLKVSKGHSPHRGGAGKHDNRPRKLRTKRAQNQRAIRDSSE